MPRRFPEIHAFDWGKHINEETTQLPGVIVNEDIEKGYIVLNKPAGVPVHPTVDNELENVAGAVGRSIVAKQRDRLDDLVDTMDAAKNGNATMQSNQTSRNQTISRRKKGKQKEEPLIYVVTPQRLDQNTSGLFVVATKKIFAGYFAKMLRTKTESHLSASNSTDLCAASTTAALGQIQKKYRCLVCIQPNKRDMGDGTCKSCFCFAVHMIISNLVLPCLR